MSGFERVSRSLGRRSFLKAAVAGVGIVLLKPFRASAQSCPAGTKECGTRCCQPGVACLDPNTSTCGCADGRQKCGSQCCVGTCSDKATSCCCAAGLTPCGPTCCSKGVACIDKVNGVCGCPSGTTQCKNGSVITCCPKGTACKPGCPAPIGTTLGCSCRAYADPCDNDGQCCSGFCASFKTDACGCRFDSECPANTPYCVDPGFCSSSPST
jgi:hypothetical protein